MEKGEPDIDKRSKIACDRCRKRRTKCSGDNPCRSCFTSNSECVFQRKIRKITIPETDIEKLQQKIESLKAELNSLKYGSSKGKIEANSSIQENIHRTPSSNTDNSQSSEEDSPSNRPSPRKILMNLGCGSSEIICWNLEQFVTKKFLLIPRFTSCAEETVYDNILMSPILESNDTVLRSITLPEAEKLLDNVVLFINCGYLSFDAILFRTKLKASFEDGYFSYTPKSNEDCFIQKVLIIFALGYVYDSKYALSNSDISSIDFELPGIIFFKKAIQSLPPTHTTSSVELTEVMALIAIYLRLCDKKNAAVHYTLHALQMCVSLNMHKEFDVENLSPEELEYRRQIWWSVYCLNRYFTSRLGHPMLLSFEEITTNYPTTETLINNKYKVYNSHDTFANAEAMKFYIELARISEKINNVYRTDYLQPSTNFVLNEILEILKQLIKWVEQIPSYLKLSLNDKFEVKNTKRLIFSLHLNYCHCVYLTTVPVLLLLTKYKLMDSKPDSDEYFDINKLPLNIHTILTIGVNASQLTINIFISLYNDNLIQRFGFVDLDYLFSSSLVFIMCIILNISINQHQEYLVISLNIINDMSMKGNLVAKAKYSQLIKLLRTCRNIFETMGVDFTKSFSGISMDYITATSQNADMTSLYASSNGFSTTDIKIPGTIFDCSFVTDYHPQAEGVTKEDMLFMDDFYAYNPDFPAEI